MQQVDSRRYLFIYPLKTNADIPVDFPQEFRDMPFETGVFLPQDDSNWFTRPPQYPARLLLLAGHTLYVIPHPASGQPSFQMKLDDLLQLETGHVLLLGWMKFITRGGVQNLAYNTRASRPLESFLSTLKRRWLGTPSIHNGRTLAFGCGLDIKFRNLLHFELDPEEAPLVQYFQQPVQIERKFLLLRRVKWRPGNLILLTSMNRLMRITDQYKQRREVYAGIGFSAPSSLLQDCRLEDLGAQRYMAILFTSGDTWRIPVSEQAEESSLFCETLNRILGSP